MSNEPVMLLSCMHSCASGNPLLELDLCGEAEAPVLYNVSVKYGFLHLYTKKKHDFRPTLFVDNGNILIDKIRAMVCFKT